MTNNARKVFIVGADMAMVHMFRGEGGFIGAPSVEEADIVVFTGGADVYPGIYGEAVDPAIRCSYNHARDTNDLMVYNCALDKFKVGICRGGQLLNVLSGGKLWYDVDGHAGSPHLAYEPTEDGKLKKPIIVTSTHHQQFIKGVDGEVFLVAYQSSIKVNANDQWMLDAEKRKPSYVHDQNNYSITDEEDDLEGIYYAKTGSMCFQPHPEYGEKGSEMRKFFFEKLEFYYQQFLEQRKMKVA